MVVKRIVCAMALLRRNMVRTTKYTCQDYRQEMVLLGLRKRLQESGLSDREKAAVRAEIKRLEAAMKMD